MILKALLIGFLVETAASVDDTLTRIPIIATITSSVKGKIAFSLGTILSLTVIVAVSLLFSTYIEAIPNIRLIISFLVFILALTVYFDLFKSRSRVAPMSYSKIKKIDTGRVMYLIVVGFGVSFITFLDDMVVMLPLFLGHQTDVIYRIIGVYLSLLIQLVLAVYFSKYIERFKYKREFASLSLVILSVLIGIDVI